MPEGEVEAEADADDEADAEGGAPRLEADGDAGAAAELADAGGSLFDIDHFRDRSSQPASDANASSATSAIGERRRASIEPRGC